MKQSNPPLQHNKNRKPNFTCSLICSKQLYVTVEGKYLQHIKSCELSAASCPQRFNSTVIILMFQPALMEKCRIVMENDPICSCMQNVLVLFFPKITNNQSSFGTRTSINTELVHLSVKVI